MGETKISIRNLYKIFGSNPQKALAKVRDGMGKPELLESSNHVLGLQDISLDIEANKLQVIMGLSGSGKSTLIRHLNRLIEPTAGEIWVDDQDVMAMDQVQLRDLRRFKMSMVFQKFALLPHRTIIENVEYGLEIQGIDAAEASKRAVNWLERVGLAGYEDYYPGQLSGGMQQRVGLARALATDADILLMDEAFSALDPLIRTDMQAILLELQQELHKTIVFITHDLDEAMRIGDSIAILRDGALVQSGDGQDIVLRPADDYIAEFTREINRGKVIRVRALKTAIQGDAPAGEPLAEGTPLEDALAPLAASETQVLPVRNAGGQITGQVTLSDAVAALHS
ncbi:glycine betaine/L-proline ABC transporter ATP-binding protein [Thalassovita sp.]|uniref:quaternary amine ABC transporter ATP-binding protein n=1 Tax=Thalassovita sp. TaxID=1979401 RepID=UPI00288121AC|nr:glycine betaine/L-proline ABC transporter ATP-binding protein [Thalassovita sp.]MDF1802676.1 glycine betaine/L-proline ABC transporter ATP-binding protein [Thalassovita sp.]